MSEGDQSSSSQSAEQSLDPEHALQSPENVRKCLVHIRQAKAHSSIWKWLDWSKASFRPKKDVGYTIVVCSRLIKSWFKSPSLFTWSFSLDLLPS